MKLRKEFDLGIRLRPTTENGSKEGDIWLDPVEGRLKVYLNGQIESFATSSSDVTGASITPTNVIYVDGVKGSDTNNGTAGSAIKTISYAIANSPSGAVIMVAPGTYNESLDLSFVTNKTIIGTGNKENVIIGGVIYCNGCSNINFYDITFNPNDPNHGIRLLGLNTSPIKFTRCNIVQLGTGPAIESETQLDEGALFEDCYIEGSINIGDSASFDSGGILIKNSTITGGTITLGNNHGMDIIKSNIDATIDQNGGLLIIKQAEYVGNIVSTKGTGTTRLVLEASNISSDESTYSTVSIGANVEYTLAGSTYNPSLITIDGAAIETKADFGTTEAGSGVSLLNDLSDVSTAGQSVGDVLTYNGTSWIPEAPSNNQNPGLTQDDITDVLEGGFGVKLISNSDTELVTYSTGALDGSGRSATVQVTTDGFSYTSYSLPESAHVVKADYGNGVHIALATTVNIYDPTSGNVDRVYRSTNGGQTFSTVILPTTANWSYIMYDTSSSAWFISGFGGGTTTLLRSIDDGLNWSPITVSESANFYSISYGNGVYVAATNVSGEVWTSPDGLVWTKRTTSDSFAYNDVTFGNGVFVRLSSRLGNSSGNLDDTVSVSSDGISWTEYNLPANIRSSQISFVNGFFFICNNVSDTVNRVVISSDGTSWTSYGDSDGFTTTLADVGYIEGRFVYTKMAFGTFYSSVDLRTINDPVTSASNLAGDQGIFSQKSNNQLQFKSLTAGSNITLTSDANSITIQATDTNTGATQLNELSDVTLGTPSDGDVLTYNNGTSQWVSSAPSGGVLNIQTTAYTSLVSSIAVNTTHTAAFSINIPAGSNFLFFAIEPQSRSNPLISTAAIISNDAPPPQTFSISSQLGLGGNDGNLIVKDAPWRSYNTPGGDITYTFDFLGYHIIDKFNMVSGVTSGTQQLDLDFFLSPKGGATQGSEITNWALRPFRIVYYTA